FAPLDGVMYRNSRIRMADVTDGLSNTLVVGETALDLRKDHWGGIWAGAARRDGGIMWLSGAYWIVTETTYRVNGPNQWAFCGPHHGGVYFLRGDGGVLFLRDSTNPRLVVQLCSRDDGSAVTLPN